MPPAAQSVASMGGGPQSMMEHSRMSSGHTRFHEQGDAKLSQAQAEPHMPDPHIGGSSGARPQSSELQLSAGHRAIQEQLSSASLSQARLPVVPSRHMSARDGSSPHSSGVHKGASSSPIEIRPVLQPSDAIAVSASAAKRSPNLTRCALGRDSCGEHDRQAASQRSRG
jgi:hypothetical protein